MIESEGIKFLDVDEISEKLHVHPDRVRLWFKRGELKGRKVAWKWYASEAAITEFLQRPHQPKVVTDAIPDNKSLPRGGLSEEVLRAVNDRLHQKQAMDEP